MNVFSFLFSSICFGAWLDLIAADKNKLQIGVKKKVENCSKRSRNGDVLKMHYTVSYCFYKFLVYDSIGFCIGNIFTLTLAGVQEANASKSIKCTFSFFF